MILERILSGAFGAGVALRNSMFDRGQFEVKRLQGPVVSIGNISVGGAGKTPFTIMLGELLKQRGVPFDILSRGYGRSTRGPLVVDVNGKSRDFGDEPLLIARKLGVDVVVGESRYEAGLLAETTWGSRLHLLDDGFQHRRLARQFDIVLVSSEDLDDVLLPAGRLREPLSSLSRANAIVVSDNTPSEKLPPNVPVWRLARELVIPKMNARRPIVFCGIAKPKNFFAQVRALGVTPAAEISFRDHYRYRMSDIARLDRLARAKNADGFLTTAKDAVNMGSLNGYEMWKRDLGVQIAELKLTVENSDAFFNEMLTHARLQTTND
jgi:tetraacyldisaccharide 4'-kinase